MIAHRVLLRFSLNFFVVFLIGRGICDEEYVIGFNDGVSSCDSFENKIFKGDEMDLGKAADGAGDALYLEGCFEFTESITEGTNINVDIEKETELGKEPMWGCTLDLCKNLEDEDSPWSEAMKSLKITKCPVEAGKYCCEKFTLDTAFAKDFMNHNFEGQYAVNFKLVDDKKTTMSCHQLGLSIFPVGKK